MNIDFNKIARYKSDLDFYRIVTHDDKVFYLVCSIRNGMSETWDYDLIKVCSWGKVANHWISGSRPLAFISDHFAAINKHTTTGVKLIKQLKKLPFKLEDLQ